MISKWGRWLAPLAVVALVAAGCGDDDGDDAASDEPTTTTEAEATTTTEAEEASGPGSFSCSDVFPGECEGTITPSEGLTDGATVSITASGFTPDLALGVTQCADADDPDHGITGETDAGDCNLRGIGNTTSDAEGNVTVEFQVVAGQTMVDNTGSARMCDATHDCVVSVGQLQPGEAERITFKVSFA